MCTIWGLGLLNGHKVYNNKAMRMLISDLMIRNTGYNVSAAGVAYCSEDEIKVAKQNIPGYKFVETDMFLKATRKRVILPLRPHPDIVGYDGWTGDLLSVLGHCRYKTKGEPENNANNHPIVCGDVVGIHNGMISNDDKLFSTLGDKVSRIGEVDSEIIFSLINYYSKHNDVDRAIKITLEEVKGSLACAMIHREYPHSIWLFRRTNSCELYLYKRVGLIAWSTSGVNLESSVKKVEGYHTDFFLGARTKIDFPENTAIRIDLRTHEHVRFKINEALSYNAWGYLG